MRLLGLLCLTALVGSAALPSSTVVLGSAPTPATYGAAVVLTATVTPSGSTGSVTFFDGSTILGVSPVSKGIATFSTMLLPAGTQSLTAQYVGSGATPSAGSTSAPLSLVVNAQSADRFVTASASPFNTGSDPISIAVGDFDKNGKADLAIANYFSNSLTVLLGNGSGGFTEAAISPIAVGSNPYAVAVADFDGDGNMDLVVANSGSNNVTVLLGNGAGGFTPAAGSPYSVGLTPKCVAVADFNGDGVADLAIGNFGTPLNGGASMTVLLGTGGGAFTAASGSPFNVGATPVSIVAGDFNGDGKADLAIANLTRNSVTIMTGDGLGGFLQASGSPYTTDTNPNSLAIGDFNGDGHPDLAVANLNSNDITILLGSASAAFTTAGPNPLPTGNSPYSLAVGDFNGDGKLDLAVANLGNNNVTLYLGNGAGVFTQEALSPFSAGSSPIALAVGDFNGDGKADLAVADETAANLSVLLGAAGVNLSGPGQSFTTLGTSNGGLYPSVPVSFTVTPCATCSGVWTATSSAPWVIITSGGTGSGPGIVSFNVFSNTTTSARTATITVTLGTFSVTYTITQAASTAPALNRQVTFLYQQTLGREPDQSGFAFWTSQTSLALGSMTGDFLDSGEGQASDFQVMAIYQAINGTAPTYDVYLAKLQALRNGTSAQSIFSALLAASPTCPFNQQGMATAQATVTCLYQNLLGRAPTSAELTAGVTLQPFTLFSNLFTSAEFQSTGTFTVDHTNSLYVTMLYYLILQRVPDQSGFAFWLNVANQGGPGIYYNQIPGMVGSSSTQLLILGNAPNEGFTGSPEFLGGFQ